MDFLEAVLVSAPGARCCIPITIVAARDPLMNVRRDEYDTIYLPDLFTSDA